MSRCWGFHVSVVPEISEAIVDVQGRRWNRTGMRAWQLDGEGPSYHESWLLREHGPVRCPVIEEVLAERDARLARLLHYAGSHAFVTMPESDESLVFEDAMMLMRAGWLAWPPKQRKEALESLREAEQREIALTS